MKIIYNMVQLNFKSKPQKNLVYKLVINLLSYKERGLLKSFKLIKLRFHTASMNKINFDREGKG